MQFHMNLHSSTSTQANIDHRLRVQMFVNQEGHIPSEMGNYHNEMFVLFIIPWLVPDLIWSEIDGPPDFRRAQDRVYPAILKQAQASANYVSSRKN